MKKTKRYGFVPKDAREGTKMAHWLSFREIAFKIGKTCGKGQVIIVVELDLVEYMMFRILFADSKVLEYASYWLVKEVACS